MNCRLHRIGLLEARPIGAGLLIFGLALVVRLLWLAEWHDTPFFRVPIGDGLRYHQWAREIAGGEWLGREVFFQAPLYPYFLGLLYSLFGDGMWVARLAQVTLGSVACLLLWRFAHRAFSPAVGLLCGVGLALYPPAIFNDGVLQKTSLTNVLLAGVLFLSSLLVRNPETRWRTPVAVLLGIALAFLALAQEHLLLMTPLIAAFLALRQREPVRSRVATLAALALGLALVFVPIGLRNQHIGGTFLITTSQFGANFYLGNNPQADGHYHAFREGRGDAEFERIDAAELAIQARGRQLTASEVSQYWLERSLSFIRAQPFEWLDLTARKLHLVWHERELPDTDSIDAYAEQSSILTFLDRVWNFGILAPLALAGVVLRRRRWREDAWLLTAIVAVTFGVAVFIIYARYRYPLVPLLMPFAAYAIVESVSAAIRLVRPGDGLAPPRDYRSLIGAFAALVVTAIAVHWPLPSRDMRAINYYSVAVRILDQGGSLAQAEQLLQRTLSIAPNEAYPYFALSVVYKRAGKFDAEVMALRKALSLAPQVTAGYEALADAERRAAAARAAGWGR